MQWTGTVRTTLIVLFIGLAGLFATTTEERRSGFQGWFSFGFFQDAARKSSHDYDKETRYDCRRRNLFSENAAIQALGCSELCLIRDVLGHDGNSLACVSFDGQGGATLARRGVAGPCGWDLDATTRGRAAEYVSFLRDAAPRTLRGVADSSNTSSSVPVAKPQYARGAVLIELHDGVTVSRDFARALQTLRIPVLAACAPSDRAAEDITLIPDMYFTRSHGYERLNVKIDEASKLSPWSKKRSRVVFRGASTGDVPSSASDLEHNLRLKLALHAKRENDRQKTASPRGGGNATAQSGPLGGSDSAASSKWDVGISSVVQVSEEVGDEIRAQGLLKHEIEAAKQVRSRGLFDVDGNTNSWSGCWWKLRSNAVVLKVSSGNQQWYYPRLVPWQHYVPVSADLSDADGRVAFVLNASYDPALEAMAARSTALTETLSYASEVKRTRGMLELCFLDGACSPTTRAAAAARLGGAQDIQQGGSAGMGEDPGLVTAFNAALVKRLGVLLRNDPDLWAAIERAAACSLFV